MLFSEKENVFMCLVAFQKIFRKIFSGVWKRRRKRQTQKNTDKTQKKNHQRSTLDWLVRRGARSRSTLDWVRRRGASRAPVRRPRRQSRSREASIAISRSTAPIVIDAVLRDQRRGWTGLELGVRRQSSDWTGARSSSFRALALSLSEIHLK